MDTSTSHDAAPPRALHAYDIGDSAESLDRMRNDFAALGDTYRVYSPARKSEAWVIHDPEDLKRVLLSNHRNYTKGLGLDRVKVLLGNGLMVSEGEFWRSQRRLMQPLFHRRVVQGFAGVIDDANRKLVARWEECARQDVAVDVTAEMSDLALGVILRALFSTDLEWLEQRTGTNPFAMVTQMPERDLRFAFRFRQLARHVVELIQRRASADTQHHDYLAMLMALRQSGSGEPMGQRELVDEVMTLIVAGHETTAASLNMTWYLLSRHRDAEERLHAELDPLVPAGPLSYVGAADLAYTRQVLQEAMRLYPPGWLLSRRAVQHDHLGGFELPAGTDVLLAPFLVHRHPRHWDEPEAFRPERFLPEASDSRHRFAYIPFAAGPRHCIGENFAMYEMTVHLAHVARRFRLHCLHEGPLEMEAGVNLRTRNNLMYRLELR